MHISSKPEKLPYSGRYTTIRKCFVATSFLKKHPMTNSNLCRYLKESRQPKTHIFMIMTRYKNVFSIYYVHFPQRFHKTLQPYLEKYFPLSQPIHRSVIISSKTFKILYTFGMQLSHDPINPGTIFKTLKHL